MIELQNRFTKILIVEDDKDMSETCARVLSRAGYEPTVCDSGFAALNILSQDENIRLVLTDLKMQGMDGIELLRQIKTQFPLVEVIIMTGHGTIANAVEAIKHGAADYITKPFDKDELLTVVEKIIKMHSLEEEIERLHKELKDKYSFSNIIGRSRKMRDVFERIVAASRIDSTVLITGDSGTGKELVARAIHFHGNRNTGPFIAVNCGALPRELIESELFGHKKGAFTGASSDAEGLFKAAVGGTIFLDEFAEMSKDTQVKLLRALQYKKIRPVGGTDEFDIDIRLVAATNQNLETALKDGLLRDDLYYRLSVITIHLPPLRERQEDIPILTQHFINKFNGVFSRTILSIDSESLECLSAYHWPGNVRELENVIEGIFALGTSDTIRISDLPTRIRGQRKIIIPTPAANSANILSDGPALSLRDAEKLAVENAMRTSKGNKSKAAQILGISRTRLYHKLEEYGISEE